MPSRTKKTNKTRKSKSRSRSKKNSRSQKTRTRSRSRSKITGGAKPKAVLEYYALGGCSACVGIAPYWETLVGMPDLVDFGLSFIKHEVYSPSVILPDAIDSLVDGFPYWTIQGHPEYVIPREYYREPLKLLKQLHEWKLIDKYTDDLADSIMKIFTGHGLNISSQF